MKEAVDFEKADKVEISIEEQEKKEVKLLGSQRQIPGLTLWEYNEITKELKRAEFKEEALTLGDILNGTTSINNFRKKVIINEGCQYFQALNRKNALRKIKK